MSFWLESDLRHNLTTNDVFTVHAYKREKKMNVFEKPHVLNIIKKPSNNLSKDKMQHKVCADMGGSGDDGRGGNSSTGDGIDGREANAKNKDEEEIQEPSHTRTSHTQ